MKLLLRFSVLCFVLQSLVEEIHCADCSNVDTTTGGPWNNGEYWVVFDTYLPKIQNISVSMQTGVGRILL